MASFTMDLWEVLEYTDDIGLGDYPIFDESYRETLNQKIIRRYWNREIGLETIDQFQWNMRRKMHEIMPYYNEMYKSQQIKFDPLSTINIETLGSGTNENTSDSKSTGNTSSETSADGLTVSSSYPQSQLDNNDTGNYADSGVETKQGGKQSNTADETRADKASGKSTASSSTKGYQGSPATLIMEYRRAILNIDLMIISDVNELFMSILNTDTEFFTNGNY